MVCFGRISWADLRSSVYPSVLEIEQVLKRILDMCYIAVTRNQPIIQLNLRLPAPKATRLDFNVLNPLKIKASVCAGCGYLLWF
jgi:hypothetical protein